MCMTKTVMIDQQPAVSNTVLPSTPFPSSGFQTSSLPMKLSPEIHRRIELVLLRMRRRRMFLYLLAAAAILLNSKKDKKTRKVRLELRLREELTFENLTLVYDDALFCRAFRMPRQAFHELLSSVRQSLQKNIEMGRRAKRPTIPPDVRLAVTLRMMAGASYLDLMGTYQMSKTSVYNVFHSTCTVLSERLQLPGLPSTVSGLRHSAKTFKMSRNPPSPLSGCVGALDGIAIKIKKPAWCHAPSTLFCRKLYYALPVQAVVDADYRFLCCSARCVGSTHDSVAHTVSALGHYLESGKLHFECWIAGDEAYVCTESLITPFPAASATDAEDAFNYYHSSLRMHVEQAFGMLVGKWRILSQLSFSLHTNARLIVLSMKLHNFVLDRADVRITRSFTGEELAELEGDEQGWYRRMKDDAAEIVANTKEARRELSRKRRSMVDIIERRGLSRPPVIDAEGLRKRSRK